MCVHVLPRFQRGLLSGYSINVLQVCQSHKRKDNLLSDICDGELFESHELYQKFLGALQLITYFDEFEPCNVLGAQLR